MHMIYWAEWRENKDEVCVVGLGSSSGAVLRSAAGVAGSGKGPLMFKPNGDRYPMEKPLTATGKSKHCSHANILIDTCEIEQKIDDAVKHIGEDHELISSCIFQEFIFGGTQDEKSAQLGMSVHQYRKKLAEGKKMIILLLKTRKRSVA
ncbi:MAG: hypothetical protein V3T17_06840 [Pseudomonadales bacterium]